MPRPIFLLAILFDVLCLCVFSVLLWHGVIPRELGVGLLGAVIGVRARWSTDHRDGPWTPPGPGTGGGTGATSSPILVGGQQQRGAAAVRELLNESAIGVLLGWSRVFT